MRNSLTGNVARNGSADETIRSNVMSCVIGVVVFMVGVAISARYIVPVVFPQPNDSGQRDREKGKAMEDVKTTEQPETAVSAAPRLLAAFDAVEARADSDRRIVDAFESGLAAGRLAERKDIWHEINKMIAFGDLGGNGTDKNAERNGLVMAANTIIQRAGG